MNLRVKRFKIGGKGEVKYSLIYLPRKKPHKLKVCEVLLRRATLNDEERQRIEDMLLRGSIGYEGECYADQYWDDLRLTFPYALLHSLEVTHQNMFHHQIDTVFVCPKFLLIVELKYIAGELYYDEDSNQLWRNYNGQRLALGDPFAQVFRHEVWMTKFLWEIGIDIPIITAVIVTAKTALIGRMPKQYNVFKIEGLSLKLKQWFEQYSDVISAEQIEKLATKLVQKHNIRRWDWQNVFKDINIQKGPICKCRLPMQYVKGSFICRCGYKSKEVILEAMNDYRLLYDEWITNKEFREFVGIPSPDTAFKWLNKLSIECIGANKARKYRISDSLLQ